MIRINLLGEGKVKGAGTARGMAAAPADRTIRLGMALAAILVPAVIIYVWQLDLAARSDRLTAQIKAALREKERLATFAKESEVLEKRRTSIERRIEAIELLKKNQSRPVLVLDRLSDCVQSTPGLWLQELNQKGRVFSLRGLVRGSPDGVADFIASLQQVGKFEEVALINIQEQNGRYAFAVSFAAPLAVEAESGRTGPAG